MVMANQYQDRKRKQCERKIAQAVERLKAADLPKAAKQLKTYTERLSSQVKPTTLETYATCLSKIARALHKDLDDLNNKDMRGYFKTLQGMSNGTRYAFYQSLRSYFCDLKRYDRQMNQDLTSKWEELMENVKRPSLSKRLMSDDDLVKPEDLQKLIKAARNTRDKAFLSMLFETGCRIGELASVEVKDVHLESEPARLYIQHSKTEDKAGRRVVYLINSIPYLKRWFDDHPDNDGNPSFFRKKIPLWKTLNRTGNAPTAGAWNVVLKRAGEVAGVHKRLYHHLFRHSRAYDLSYNYGLGLKEIKETLGHTQIQTTDGYLTINKDLMIQKLKGGVDEKEVAKKREQAIKEGQPVTCVCGVQNEPRRAFCYSCGRVINSKVAKELITQKDEEKGELEQRMKRMEKMLELIVASGMDADSISEAIRIKKGVA